MASQLVTQLTALVRFSILARILGPDQLGLAAIIILAMQFFDFVSDAGMDRFLIQSPNGDDPDVQKMIHLVSVGRGLFLSGAIFLGAGAIADFYNNQLLEEAFRIVTLAPLIQGAIHYDMRRLQRHQDYHAEAWMAFSEPAGVVVTGIAAYLTHSCVAVSYGLVTRAVAMVVISWLVAERRYRIGPSRQHFQKLARFGTPLMMNGVLMFVTNQGDRLFVSAMLPLNILAHYSTVLLLIYYPAAIISRLIQAFNLPLLSKSLASPVLYKQAVDTVVEQTVGIGLLMLLGFIAVTPIAIPLLFGPIYRQPLHAIALVALLQIVRYARIWPTTVALGEGRTQQVLINSLVRFIAFPAGYLGHLLIGGLEGLLMGIAAGEFAALLLGILSVNHWGADRTLADLRRLALLVAEGVAIWLSAAAFDRGEMMIAAAAGGLAVAVLVYLVIAEGALISTALALVLGRYKRERV